nr:MAG TPA: hypothetical protein [Caudoviricetes sp.]
MVFRILCRVSLRILYVLQSVSVYTQRSMVLSSCLRQ